MPIIANRPHLRIDLGGAMARSVSYTIQGGVFKKGSIRIGQFGLMSSGGKPGTAVSSGDFTYVCELGRGASSKVFKAVHKSTNTQVAIKVMQLGLRSVRHQLYKELQAYAKLRSNHIVQYYGAFFDQQAIHLVMELMDAG